MTWTRNAEGDWIAKIPGSPIPVVLQRVWGGWQGWRGTTRSAAPQSIALALHDLASMARSERIAWHLRMLRLPPHPPEVIVYRRGPEWWAELSVLRDGVSRVDRGAFSGDSAAQAVALLAELAPDPSVRAAIGALPWLSDCRSWSRWSRWRVLDAPENSSEPAQWVAELEVDR